MELARNKCGKTFAPRAAQAAAVERGTRDDTPLLMLKCPHCGRSFPFGPVASAPPKETQPPLRCPVSRCDGLVSHVSDPEGAFWGCGECGNVWRTRAELDEAKCTR